MSLSFQDSAEAQLIRVQTPDVLMLETLSLLPESWRVWVRQFVAFLALLRTAGHLPRVAAALPRELQETLGHLLPFLRHVAPPAKRGR